jgi:hypothetical protein
MQEQIYCDAHCKIVCWSGHGTTHMRLWSSMMMQYIRTKEAEKKWSLHQYNFLAGSRKTVPLACRSEVIIHSVFCLTTGSKPPPERFLHIVRSRISSFRWEYPLLSLGSSSSFLRLLFRLLVTSISLFIFPSITCSIENSFYARCDRTS